jgi:hypothetical protein
VAAGDAQGGDDAAAFHEARLLVSRFGENLSRLLSRSRLVAGVFPQPQKKQPPDPAPVNRPVNGISKTRHFDWCPVAKPAGAMGDYTVADWVIGQLKRKHDKPCFLACGIYRPHLP